MSPVSRIASVFIRVMVSITLTLVIGFLAIWGAFSSKQIEALRQHARVLQDQERRFLQPGTALEGCAERGGVVSRGPTGVNYCRVEYRDAGRSCTDTSECLGGCIALDEDVRPQSDGRVKGSCKAANVQYGCFSYVEAGQTIRTQCVD